MARLYYPAGRYELTSTLKVPSGALLEGDGHDTVFIATGDFPAITVLDTDATDTANTVLRNFSVERTNTAGEPALQDASDGILWLGSDGLVENVWLRDHYVGFRTEDHASLTTDRLVLRNVRVSHSNPLVETSLFGFQIDGVRDLRLDDCTASGNWLDGLKIRKNTRSVLVTGGCYHDNGESGAGDGIDAYSGGHLFRALGVVCQGNASGGINVKSGELSVEPIAADAFGYVRGIDIAHCTLRDNGGIGLDINRNTAANPTTEPLVNAITITGCLIEDNGLEGLNIRGRNAVVTGCIVRGNAPADSSVHGATVAVESMDVVFQNCAFVGNGGEQAGIANLYVAGTRVRVLDCTFVGKDAQTIDADGDYAGLTAQAAYGCLFAATAADCLIRDPAGHSHGTGLVDAQAAIAGHVRVDMSGTGDPETVVIGGVGSTFRRTDGGADSVLYVKDTAASSDVKTGWTPLAGA